MGPQISTPLATLIEMGTMIDWPTGVGPQIGTPLANLIGMGTMIDWPTGNQIGQQKYKFSVPYNTSWPIKQCSISIRLAKRGNKWPM